MKTEQTVFVTGATSLVGSAVVRRFVREGYRIRALVRCPERAEKLGPRSIDLITGDITRADGSLREAMRGCVLVIHAAALHDVLLDDPERFDLVNFEGTKNVLRAAQEAGVPEFLYTSSIKSIGKDPSCAPSDEGVPYNVAHCDGHYGLSKQKAEEFVLAYQGPVTVKLVNPAMVAGAPDEQPTPLGRMVRDFLKGKIPFYIDTIMNIVNLEDVAEAHFLVFTKGRPRQRYIVCAESMTMEEFFAVLGEMAERPPPALKVPYTVLLPASYGLLAANRMFGSPLPLHPRSVRMARMKIAYDGSRISRELGLRYSPVKEGLRSAVRYFKNLPEAHCSGSGL